MSTFSSPVPAGCRFTSGFGRRWGTLHAGTDWAPPSPGQRGVAVYAPCDMTILNVGYGYGRASDVVPYHSGRFIWADAGVHGGDRMRIYLGHLASYSVKTGQKVKAGQQVGVMGGSGSSGENHFAIHLHFGVAQNTTRPVAAATRRGGPGWIDSRAWLASKGVTIGKTSPVKASTVSTSTASSTGSSSSTSTSTGPHVRNEASIRQICIKAGHGTSKNTTGLLIERYQHRQVRPFTLVHDRVWGNVTDKHYRWTLVLQRRMNNWAGTKVAEDGDYRARTHARVRELQRRNAGGAYKGRVDGIAGPVFCRMLGIANYPN